MKEIQIGNSLIKTDKAATEKFYLSQKKITDDCQCADCKFYAETVTNYPFEIFEILRDLGVDVEKNLDSEPTGAWCVRDDNGKLLHCDQAYKFSGDLGDKGDFEYLKVEGDFRIRAEFRQIASDSVYVALDIGVQT
jgi:hypothetical protein